MRPVILVLVIALALPADSLPSSLEGVVRRHIASFWTSRGVDAEVEFRRNPSAAYQGGEIRIADEAIRLTGLATIPIEIVRQGLATERIYASVRIRTYADAYVAARPIEKGEPLDSGLFEIRRTEITGLQDRIVTPGTSLLGMRARSFLRSGTILTSARIGPVPLVRRNDEVSVRVLLGKVCVSRRGRALGEGERGDELDVALDGARSPVRAQVVDRNTVVLRAD